VRDLPRHLASEISLENTTNDRGLRRHNLQFARLSRDGVIAICPAARVATIAHHALHSAPYLVFEILELLAVDDRSDPIGQRRHNAINRRGEPDAGELKALADAGPILLVAANAAPGFRDDNIESTRPRGAKKLLDAFTTMNGSARNGAIAEGCHDQVSLTLAVGPAECNLVVNRTITLKIR